MPIILYGAYMKSSKDSLGMLVFEVGRLMRRTFEANLDGSSLSLAQARLLFYVNLNEGARQVALAEMLEVQPISAARLIDQLVQMGVVERRLDPSDRRAHLIYLTPAAEPHLASIQVVLTKVRANLLRDISADELQIMVTGLRKVRDSLSSR